MNKVVGLGLSALLVAPLLGVGWADAAPRSAQLEFVGRYDSGAGETGAEIVTFDRQTKTMLVTNGVTNTIDVVSLARPDTPTLLGRVDLDPYGISVQSVATFRGRAVAIVAGAKRAGIAEPTVLDPGAAVFFDIRTRRVVGTAPTGVLPDGVTWSDDGTTVVVANEGEPRCVTVGDRLPTTDPALAENPEGSVTVIEVDDLRPQKFDVDVKQVDFRKFNGRMEVLRQAGVRVGIWPGATVAQDLEPEYPTIDGDRAYVTLQENNAIATIDLDDGKVLAINPLGLKDRSDPSQAFDPSDRDGSPSVFGQVTAPVSGMYMPDAIDTMRFQRRTYLFTANEGDGREYFANLDNVDEIDGVDQSLCFSDEARLGSLTLDSTVFTDAGIKNNARLGRLKVTTTFPSVSSDPAGYSALATYGGRSMSVWSASGQLVWDSGTLFEQMVYNADPAGWSTAGVTPLWSAAQYDTRSDDKGPEPEGLVLGTHRGRTYAFVGLERAGGIVVLDVTDPRSPVFQQWLTVAGDVSPEGLAFVPASDTPGRRDPLVLVAHEGSGTTSVLRLTL